MKTLAILLVLALVSCTDTESAPNQYVVKVYSGGELIATYAASKRPWATNQSDHWKFVDQDTGMLVIVSGTVIIEMQQ